jgi:hypothetical protein
MIVQVGRHIGHHNTKHPDFLELSSGIQIANI